MSTTISEAARRWGICRETIYRRRRGGQLKFATTKPSTVAACEMLRVFGEPKPKPNKAAGSATVVALTRLEAMCEMLKAENERLKTELATVKAEFRDARDDARRERDRLLELLAAQQRVIEDRVGMSMLVPQPAEMTEAEAVLAAQRRVESQSHQRD
jgi:transposase-like protein